MKIRKITLENFGKHSNKEFPINPITIVKGANGSGKSSIVEAISYNMIGSVRRLNKKLEDISKLSSNNTGCLSVKVETDENIITRSIIQKRSKLSEVLECSDIDSSLNNTERQMLLKEKYLLDELLINPLNFINLSSMDKSKYLISLLNRFNNGEIARNRVIGKIKNTGDNLVTNSCLKEFSEDKDILESIDNSIKFANSYKRITAKEIKENVDNAYKIADLKNSINSFNKAEVEKIPEVEKNINEMKVNLKIQLETEVRYNSIKEQIDIAEKIKSKNINVSSLKKEAEEIKSKIAELYKIKEDEEALKELSLMTENLFSIKERGIKNNSSIDLIKSQIKQLSDLNLRIAAISTSRKCLLDDSIVCNNSFNNKVMSLKNEIDNLKTEIAKLELNRNQLRKEYSSVNKDILVLTERVEKSKEAYKKAQINIKTLNEELEKKRFLYIEYMDCENKLNLLKEELKKSIPEDTTMLLKFINSNEEELKELYKKKNNYIELNQALILAQKEDLKREEKENLLEDAKKLEKMLKEERLKLLEDGIKPFQEIMDQILKELDFNYNVFVKNDGKKAIIGLHKDEMDIEMDRLSTGETMMFIISLIGAIYKKQESKFRLLVLDDLDNLDMNNLEKLLSNRSVLTKYFDNVLLIGVLANIDLSKYKSEQCSIIEM